MKRIIVLLLLLLLAFSPAHATVTVTKYVDTDVVGGAGDGTSWANAYSSLASAEAANQADLVTNEVIGIFQCRGVADDAPTVFTGWETGPNNYLVIRGDASTGIWDDSVYTVHNDDNAQAALNIAENYVRIENVQTLVTCTTFRHGIYYGSIDADGADERVGGCIIKGVNSGTGSAIGVFANDEDVTDIMVYNTVIYGFISGADNGFKAFESKGANVNLYNNSITGNYIGVVKNGGGTYTSKNNVLFNNFDDISGGFEITYTACDDADCDSGTGNIGWDDSAATWNANFKNYTTNDFRLKATSALINTGTDNPSSGLYLDDIAGKTRVSPWDIGAFEYIPSGVGGWFFGFF